MTTPLAEAVQLIRCKLELLDKRIDGLEQKYQNRIRDLERELSESKLEKASMEADVREAVAALRMLGQEINDVFPEKPATGN